MNDNHTFAPEMTAEGAIQMVFKRPEMYGLQKVAARQPTEDDREALATLLDEVHGPCITEGGCNFSGWTSGYMTGSEVSDVVDELIARWPRAAVPDAATEDMTVAEFCEALGFVDDSTTPAKLRDIVEPIQWWGSEARDHVECARICEQCGETLARTLCGECHGGGQRDGGNGTVSECGNCGGAGWLHKGCAEVAYADLVAERDDLEERLAGYLCDSTGGLLSKTGYDVRTMVAHTEEYYDGLHADARKEIEAERDAAIAAVGRVRAIAEEGVWRDTKTSGDWAWALDHMAHKILAALDGAPEPEGRWEYRGRLQSCGYVAKGYISAEHAMNGLKVELEDHPYIQMDDTAIVERARVREWLPVEGESK